MLHCEYVYTPPNISHAAFLFANVIINKDTKCSYILPTIKLLRDVKHRPRSNTRQTHRDSKWQPFYQSKTWRLLRASWLMDHPLCERCLSQNCVTPAEEVHHIQPFSWAPTTDEQWRLFKDESNLMSLCSKCHHDIHKELNDKKHLQD